MNCQKFESVVADLAHGQLMEAEVLAGVQEHRAECSVCASRLRDEEMLSRGLRSLAIQMNSLEVPASIETRLLNAFRQPNVVVPLPRQRDYRPYWLTAIAAVLLIVIGVVAMRWRGSDPPKPMLAEVPSAPQVEAVKEAVTPSPKPRDEITKPKTKLRPRHSYDRDLAQASSRTGRNRNDNVLNHASNEVATEFMPLGYLNPATFQDGGQILRVEVPRTTLASFGFPVNMDRYNEKVKADVLVGVDGVAHAIRFVQEKRLQ